MPLEPRRVEGRADAADTFTAAFAQQTFTCRRVGTYQIWIWIGVRTRAEVNSNGTLFEREQRMVPWMTRDSNGNHYQAAGRCVAPDLETPTVDPTTESTFTPTAEPTSEPTSVPTSETTDGPPAVSTPPGAATPAAFGDQVPDDHVLVFVLDGVYYLPGGLQVIDAHLPFCSYVHVHGGTISSLLPGPGGSPLTRSEHLGECGFGPPNFFIVSDPRPN